MEATERKYAIEGGHSVSERSSHGAVNELARKSSWAILFRLKKGRGLKGFYANIAPVSDPLISSVSRTFAMALSKSLAMT
jgi:hypothetical protein